MSTIEIGTYMLPAEQRIHFKIPLGNLYKTSEEINLILEQLKTELSNIPLLICVGDAVTKTILDFGIDPDLIIVDGKIQRKKTKMIDKESFAIEIVDNPQGKITSMAWLKIKEKIKEDGIKTIIKINGEEDLLSLPAVLEAPKGSKIIYGQPNEGIVIIDVNNKKKFHVINLMNKMVKIDES